MSDGAEKDADIAAADRALALLTEHFENVTVFASRHDGGTGYTISLHRGSGNWHARHGQIREWVTKRDAEARVQARRDMDSDD